MLRTADFKNFTSVPAGKWSLSKGLNVLISENGLGKSHVLKALYSVLKAQSPDGALPDPKPSEPLSKTALEKKLADELMATFRPDSLGRLVKRRQGRNRAEIALRFTTKSHNIAFGFATNSRSQVDIEILPSQAIAKPPVFIPTRELITLCPWFLSLYDGYSVPFEKTWRDTVLLLGAPSLRGPREKTIKQMLLPIEDAMGGQVEVDANGRFFLRVNGGKMEAALVAEGLRKFAMLARLISTGVLLEQGYLFWDEPETNLNPKLIKVLARVIAGLADQGIQVFIATHSLFLLRELSIIEQDQRPTSPPRYFALKQADSDEISRLEQGDSIDELETLVVLDEEMTQSDRFMDTQ